MNAPSRPMILLLADRESEMFHSAYGPEQSQPEENANDEINSDLIAICAYDKWVRQGRPSGTALQNWLEAETELKNMKDLTQQLAETNAILREAIAEAGQREEALRQVEERFRGIFDNAIVGIFQTASKGRFLVANPALAHMLGYASPEELVAGISDIGQQLHVTPERRDEFQRLLHEHGHVQGFECQVYRKDSSIIWISLTARAVCDADGALRYYEGMVVDISERKRTEEALQNSEALYQSLVETLPVCIFRKDLDGRFIFGNRTFCERLKKPLSDIIGKTDPDFYPREMAHKYIRDDRRVMETGDVLEAIEEHAAPGAEQTYVQVLKAPVLDSGGEVVGMQGIFWDVTPQKRAEGELERTAAEFRLARKIQQKLFPIDTPKVAGLDIGVATFRFDIGGASYPAAAIGGDYYDFIPLCDGSLGIAIGDVSGHGVGPALLMAEARALLRAFAQTQSDVSAILNLVNRVLVPDVEGDRFITLLLAKLNLRERCLGYSSAGHITGYVLDAAGNVKKALPSTAIPLGIEASTDFPAGQETPLEPGDLVLLVTDGVLEARSPDGTLFGQQRTLEVVRTYRETLARRIVNHLYNAVRAFSENLTQYDDITAVVIKVNPFD